MARVVPLNDAEWMDVEEEDKASARPTSGMMLIKSVSHTSSVCM